MRGKRRGCCRASARKDACPRWDSHRVASHEIGAPSNSTRGDQVRCSLRIAASSRLSTNLVLFSLGSLLFFGCLAFLGPTSPFLQFFHEPLLPQIGHRLKCCISCGRKRRRGLGDSLFLLGISGRLPLISVGQETPETRPWLQIHSFFLNLLASINLCNYQTKVGSRQGTVYI